MSAVGNQGQHAGGLYAGFEAYRTHSSEELRHALRSCLVVFDTNVLLNLYRYNEETRASIVDVMSALGDRRWVPHQVLEEFWRNRERALSDPLGQVQQTSNELEKLRAAAVEQLRMWVNRAALNSSEEEAVESSLDAAFGAAQGLLDGLIDEEGVSRAKNTRNDRVLDSLESVLAGKVGPPMSAEDYTSAIKEGHRRVEAGEPPGFGDAKKANRGGEGAAGDYLVWEQVLREASTRQMPVLFVTGDVKRDWWRFEGSSPRGPRVELARELNSRCGQDLVMLRPETLLELADALSVSVRPGAVEDVERTTRLEEAEEDVRDATGWTPEAVETLLRKLKIEAPVQEATIRYAAQNGGFVGRDEVYSIGEYEPSRQLKGFTRPVNRHVQALRDIGTIPEDAVDVLVPVYDEGKHGFGWVDGFRIPAEIIQLVRS